MLSKKFIAGALLAFGLLLGWKYLGAGLLNKPLPPAAAIKFDNDLPPAAGDHHNELEPPASQRKTASGIHKCKVGSSVIYTDAPCDKPGSEQALGGGSVTVVKGQRPTASPASGSDSAPNVRDMLVGKPNPNEPSLKDQQMDRIIGR